MFAFHPTKLAADVNSMMITWNDGRSDRLPWMLLRDRCPCATCKVAREKPPKPASLLPVLSAAEAQPLRPTKVEPAGNYAYAIHFSDGHNTGIYSLDLLRELGDAVARTT